MSLDQLKKTYLRGIFETCLFVGGPIRLGQGVLAIWLFDLSFEGAEDLLSIVMGVQGRGWWFRRVFRDRSMGVSSRSRNFSNEPFRVRGECLRFLAFFWGAKGLNPYFGLLEAFCSV